MTHDLKKELIQSMDAIYFSREAKDAMTDSLLVQMASRNAGSKKHGGKKLLLIALAAALLLATLTGAAVFTRWSKSMSTFYNAAQEQREQAESLGLSAILETGASGNEVLSATDQGVTISAIQSIADKYSAQLTFRVEGFALPEGEKPSIQIASIEVKDVHGVNTHIRFFDGTTTNGMGEQVYWDGSPLRYNADGTAELNYAAKDGSLEFTTTLIFSSGGEQFGKEIEVHFSALGTETRPSLLPGDWTLKWTLTGTTETIVTKPKAPIGDTGITLLEAEVTPISVFAAFKLDNTDGHINNNAETFDPGREEAFRTVESLFAGIRMKDGTIHTGLTINMGFSTMPSDEGIRLLYPEYASEILEENGVLIIYCQSTNRILEPDQVDAYVFLKSLPGDGEQTEEDFYIVPIR